MPEVTSSLATPGATGWVVNPNWSAVNALAVNPPPALWANRALFQTEVGRQVQFTDVGGGNPSTGGGATMRWNGTRWKPVNSQVLLDAIDTANVGAANATEQQLNPNHAAIPAGLTQNYDRFLVRITLTKSGATDAATLRLRLGPAGTAADALLATVAIAAGTQSFGGMIEFKRLSATSVEQEGNADTGTSFSGPSANASPAAVAVSSMDSNTMYMSLTVQMTAGTEAPTLKDYTLELLAAEG